MIKRTTPRIFFGWWTVWVIGVMAGVGQGFYQYGISVFFKPIATSLGLSRGIASLATGFGRLEGGLESPITGLLSDRFGPRRIVLIGVLFISTAIALMSIVNSAWSYVVVWGAVGIGSNLGLTIATDKAITNWFIRKRGLALGIKFVLHGIILVIMLPILTWLLLKYDWRMTMLIWSGVTFLAFPLFWFFIKQNRPEYYGLLPDGATVKEEEKAADTSQMISKGVEYAAEFGEVEFTIRQGIKTRTYWMLLVGSVGSLISGVISIHLIPFLTDMGISQTTAANMYALMAFVYIPSRFFVSFVADRIRKDRLQFLVAAVLLFDAAGVAAILISQSIPMIYVFLIVYGFGDGAMTPIRLYAISRYFGRKAFTTFFGSFSLVTAPLGLIAPVFAGWIYDITGEYTTALLTLVILAVVAAVLILLLLRPPKPPAEVGDIRKFV